MSAPDNATVRHLRKHPWVWEAWREFDGCFGQDVPSYWVTLRGRCVDGEEGFHQIHEATSKDVRAALRRSAPCACRECQQHVEEVSRA